MLQFREFFSNNGHSEQEIVSMYLNHPNRKITELAHNTQKSVGEIYRILHSNGIKPNRLRINQQNVVDFANSGLSITQISELTGYTTRNVRYIIAKLKMD